MSRLFVTPRELNFISDITKELVKDVIGQRIHYYPISELKTKSHEVYNEAIEKIWDNPILLDAIVDAKFQNETKITQFGVDTQYNLEVFVQYRDLIEKGIKPCLGDFITYGEIKYEIIDATAIRNIYGEAEHKDGVKLTCTRAREGQFDAPIQGPTDIRFTDEDAIQETWQQQRGQSENNEGETGDVRDLQKNEVLEAPIEDIREVSRQGDNGLVKSKTSSFYDE
jgi:hypothetical protein